MVYWLCSGRLGVAGLAGGQTSGGCGEEAMGLRGGGGGVGVVVVVRLAKAGYGRAKQC